LAKVRFDDHYAAGTGEPLSVLLGPGNAGEILLHIAVIKAALAQLPHTTEVNVRAPRC
jgi:hypothetical protein